MSNRRRGEGYVTAIASCFPFRPNKPGRGPGCATFVPLFGPGAPFLETGPGTFPLPVAIILCAVTITQTGIFRRDTEMTPRWTRMGVVAIGRNEGKRLERCLASVVERASAVVYVDSGSTDDSVGRARSRGVATVELDMSIPFTAARARNEGFAKLLEVTPEVEFVQFVDGDCEIVEGWLERAEEEMRAHPEAAVVCGRRRERFP